MVIVEGHIVESSLIETLAGEVISQNGGVALHQGVELLLGDKVAGDALDLLRRTAVESGDGDAGADMGIDAADILGKLRQLLLGLGNGVFECLGTGGILHAFDEAIDLRRLDPGKIIPNAHVEHEAVGVAQMP